MNTLKIISVYATIGLEDKRLDKIIAFADLITATADNHLLEVLDLERVTDYKELANNVLQERFHPRIEEDVIQLFALGTN